MPAFKTGFEHTAPTSTLYNLCAMMSEDQYQNLIAPNKIVNTAILNWRNQLTGNTDIGLSDSELEAARKDSAGRESSWDE